MLKFVSAMTLSDRFQLRQYKLVFRSTVHHVHVHVCIHDSVHVHLYLYMYMYVWSSALFQVFEQSITTCTCTVCKTVVFSQGLLVSPESFFSCNNYYYTRILCKIFQFSFCGVFYQIGTEDLVSSYCYKYGFKAVGLRFFSVYGPWGRPDGDIYAMTSQIDNGKQVHVYRNNE